MITLNILSQEVKNQIKIKLISEIIKQICYIMLIFTVTVTIILIAGRSILQNFYFELSERSTLVTKNTEAFGENISKINSQLSQIATLQENYYPISSIVEKIMTISNNNIKFTSIRIDLMTKAIELKGHCPTRNDFLVLKDNLSSEGSFENIVFPIETLLKDKDLEFTLTAKLKI